MNDGLNDASIQALLKIGAPMQYKNGDYICHEGAPGESLFIVLNGKVEMHVQMMNDDNSLIDSLCAGSFFGETALLVGEPYNASYIAAEATICIAIHRSCIRDMLQSCPDMAEKLLFDMSARLRTLNDQIYRAQSQQAQVRIQPFALPKEYREHPISGVRYAPDKYLMKTNVLCPVCGKPIEISHLRMNELMCIKVLNNQRHIYNGFEILWHYVWKCRRCGYANFHSNFFKKPAVNQAMILRLISMQNQTLQSISTRFPIDGVILDYYRAIHFNESLNASNVVLIAKLWRYLCWLYTDADDLEMANFCRDKSLFYYRYLHQKEQDILTTEDSRQQCAMIIAELYLEKGEFDKAKPYYDEVIKYRGKVLAQRAYDRLYEIMDG